jgi:DNA invertase Pin-like site-specific DNA recombinase
LGVVERVSIMSTKFVTYYRVSTPKQGQSGLGLEAQQISVRAHLEETKGVEVATFTEVETGKNNASPKLQEALLRCRQTRATLLVAKFDRLSRNAAFLLTLRDSGMKFVAADMPTANDLTIGVLAVVAEHEREMISKRTKEALAAAKARGTKLGNPQIKPGDDYAASLAREQAARLYAERAEDLRPIVDAAKTTNASRLCEYFAMLGIPSPRGKDQWNAHAARRLMRHLAKVPGNS